MRQCSSRVLAIPCEDSSGFSSHGPASKSRLELKTFDMARGLGLKVLQNKKMLQSCGWRFLTVDECQTIASETSTECLRTHLW